MKINAADSSDLDETIACLAAAFAQDPITGFLLETGPGYSERVKQFFSLLMRARLALRMPVLVARDPERIQGAAMGYATAPPAWPIDLGEDWDRFENATAGLPERMAVYDKIAADSRPSDPHYYLGVIGVAPDAHSRGIGTRLLASFCELSATDELSQGVYLETAEPSNVGFYQRAGFVETGRGTLGSATLWCMYLSHGR